MPPDDVPPARRPDSQSNLTSLAADMHTIKAQMVTKDWLREYLDEWGKHLVSLDLYTANRTADNQRVNDHGARLTSIETDFRTFERTFYRQEVADARQFGQVQAGTQQQLGSVATQAQQGIGQAQAKSTAALNSLLLAALGVLGGGLISVIIAFIGYAAMHH